MTKLAAPEWWVMTQSSQQPRLAARTLSKTARLLAF